MIWITYAVEVGIEAALARLGVRLLGTRSTQNRHTREAAIDMEPGEITAWVAVPGEPHAYARATAPSADGDPLAMEMWRPENRRARKAAKHGQWGRARRLSRDSIYRTMRRVDRWPGNATLASEQP